MEMIGKYWVYIHKTPDGMVYVGRSGRKSTEERWIKSRYEKTSLYPYIEKYGMDNIEHFFIDGLSKEESFRLEGNLLKCIEKWVFVSTKRIHMVYVVVVMKVNIVRCIENILMRKEENGQKTTQKKEKKFLINII